MIRAWKRQRGITLVELLAALVISAFVVALASRLLLTGQKQFLARVFESDRLSALVRLKGAMHQALGAKVSKCAGGSLFIATDSTDLDMTAWIKSRYPGVESLEFRCFEVEAGGDDLVEWKERFQPQLVEYRAVIKIRDKTDPLVGSILK